MCDTIQGPRPKVFHTDSLPYCQVQNACVYQRGSRHGMEACRHLKMATYVTPVEFSNYAVTVKHPSGAASGVTDLGITT